MMLTTSVGLILSGTHTFDVGTSHTLFNYSYIIEALVQANIIFTGSLPLNIKYSCPYDPPILLPHIFTCILTISSSTMKPSEQPTELPRSVTYVSPSSMPTRVLSTENSFDPIIP